MHLKPILTKMLSIAVYCLSNIPSSFSLFTHNAELSGQAGCLLGPSARCFYAHDLERFVMCLYFMKGFKKIILFSPVKLFVTFRI